MGSSEASGSSISAPYFYVMISDDKDITVKPQLFDNNKFLLQNEFRQKTKKTLSILDFGFTLRVMIQIKMIKEIPELTCLLTQR